MQLRASSCIPSTAGGAAATAPTPPSVPLGPLAPPFTMAMHLHLMVSNTYASCVRQLLMLSLLLGTRNGGMHACKDPAILQVHLMVRTSEIPYVILNTQHIIRNLQRLKVWITEVQCKLCAQVFYSINHWDEEYGDSLARTIYAPCSFSQ